MYSRTQEWCPTPLLLRDSEKVSKIATFRCPVLEILLLFYRDMVLTQWRVLQWLNLPLMKFGTIQGNVIFVLLCFTTFVPKVFVYSSCCLFPTFHWKATSPKKGASKHKHTRFLHPVREKASPSTLPSVSATSTRYTADEFHWIVSVTDFFMTQGIVLFLDLSTGPEKRRHDGAQGRRNAGRRRIPSLKEDGLIRFIPGTMYSMSWIPPHRTDWWST